MRIFGVLVLWLFWAVFASADSSFEAFESRLNDLESPLDQLTLANQEESEIDAWTQTDQGRFWHRKGLILEANQDIHRAQDAFATAIRLFEQAGTVSQYWVQSLIDLSYMQYLLTNDPEQYCQARQDAVRLARQLNNSEVLAGTVAQLAYCYQNHIDDFKTGLSLLQEALDLAEKDQLSSGFVASIHNATGNLYRNNKIPEKAYEYYQKAHDHWAEEDDTSDMFNMQHNMVGEAIELGRWEAATTHVDTLYAMANAADAKDDFMFFAHLNAGRTAYAVKLFAEAAKALEQAANLQHTTAERYFVDMANALLVLSHFRAGDHEQAKTLAEQYIQQPNQSELFYAWNEQIALVVLYLNGEHEQTMEKFWQVFDAQAQNQQAFMNNAVAAQAIAFDQTMGDLQDQALALRAEQAESQDLIARLTTYVTILGVALLVVALLLLIWTTRRHKQNAETDFLTGSASRRHIIRQGERLMAKVDADRPLSILLMDIDDFKAVNDHYGHAVGDEVLKLLVKTIQEISKHPLGRYGGEEFLMLMPKTPAAEGLDLAERLRLAIESQSIDTAKGPLRFTVSMGLATYHQSAGLEALIDRADLAMYVSKSHGKNQVTDAADHDQNQA